MKENKTKASVHWSRVTRYDYDDDDGGGSNNNNNNY